MLQVSSKNEKKEHIFPDIFASATGLKRFKYLFRHIRVYYHLVNLVKRKKKVCKKSNCYIICLYPIILWIQSWMWSHWCSCLFKSLVAMWYSILLFCVSSFYCSVGCLLIKSQIWTKLNLRYFGLLFSCIWHFIMLVKSPSWCPSF